MSNIFSFFGIFIDGKSVHLTKINVTDLVAHMPSADSKDALQFGKTVMTYELGETYVYEGEEIPDWLREVVEK